MSAPVYRTRFVGREDDLARIDGTHDRGARIVTIHGPGGIGKTRLAVEYARTWRHRHRRPTAFCSLAPARGLADVCETVAGALGVQIGHAGGDDANVQRIGEWLAQHDGGLIVMDNLERITDVAGPAMHAWATAAPDVMFLGTSQQRLGVAGEAVVPVDALPADDGLRLFADRVPRQRAEMDERIVARILQRLEGIPLAIELAAARLEVLSLSELAAHLDERFRTLRDPTRGEGRHATLWTTLLWSWDGLETWERQALAQLSVFVGDVPVDAARDVLSLSEDAPDVPAVLDGLATKSLLRPTDPDRYLLYDTVREFAAHQLGAAGPVEQRHAHWFAERGLSWSRRIHGPDGAGHRRRLRDERDNLVAAVERSAVSERWTDAAHALRALHPILMGSPSHAWYVAHLDAAAGQAGHEAEWLRFLRGMTARHSREVDAAEALFQQALGTTDPELEASALLALAEVARQRNDPEREAALHDRVLDVARGAGLTHLEAEAIRCRSMQDLWLGRIEQGVRRAGQAVELARACGDAFQEGYALCVLGMLRGDQLRRDDEVSATRRAAEAFRTIGDTRTESWARGNLGTALLAIDALDDARAALEQAVALRERFLDGSSAYMVQIFHVYLGLIAALQDRPGDAVAHLEPAEKQLGDEAQRANAWYHGNALAALAAAHLRSGALSEAAARAEQAEARLSGLQTRSAEVPRALARFVRDAAAVRRAVESGDREAARAALGAAEAHRHPGPDIWVSVARFVGTCLEAYRRDATAWWVAEDGSWFEPPEGARTPVDQPRLAGMVAALAGRDDTITVEGLAAAVWPEEHLVLSSARARVYTAIHELRRLGLPIRTGGGYAFDDAVVLL